MQLLLTLSLLASLSSRALGISCYLCESAYDENCGEDFEIQNYYKFDCARVPAPRFLERDLESPNATACMKKVYQEADVQKIIRSCFFGDVNDTAIGCRTDPSLTAAVREIDCHVCDNENYCNGAEVLAIYWQPNLLLAFVSLLRYLTLQRS